MIIMHVTHALLYGPMFTPQRDINTLLSTAKAGTMCSLCAYTAAQRRLSLKADGEIITET